MLLVLASGFWSILIILIRCRPIHYRGYMQSESFNIRNIVIPLIPKGKDEIDTSEIFHLTCFGFSSCFCQTLRKLVFGYPLMYYFLVSAQSCSFVLYTRFVTFRVYGRGHGARSSRPGHHWFGFCRSPNAIAKYGLYY